MIELATKGPEISGLKNESENYRNTIRKKRNGWVDNFAYQLISSLYAT